MMHEFIRNSYFICFKSKKTFQLNEQSTHSIQISFPSTSTKCLCKTKFPENFTRKVNYIGMSSEHTTSTSSTCWFIIKSRTLECHCSTVNKRGDWNANAERRSEKRVKIQLSTIICVSRKVFPRHINEKQTSICHPYDIVNIAECSDSIETLFIDRKSKA